MFDQNKQVPSNMNRNHCIMIAWEWVWWKKPLILLFEIWSLTLRMASTTFDRPACTATVLIVVVDGVRSEMSVISEALSDILISLFISFYLSQKVTTHIWWVKILIADQKGVIFLRHLKVMVFLSKLSLNFWFPKAKFCTVIKQQCMQFGSLIPSKSFLCNTYASPRKVWVVPLELISQGG